MKQPKLDRSTKNFQCRSRCDNSRKQCKYSPSNSCEQHIIIESTISQKIKEVQDEQNKQFPVKIELKLDAMKMRRQFLMMKMFLISDIHQQAKNIIQCMLRKRIL